MQEPSRHAPLVERAAASAAAIVARTPGHAAARKAALGKALRKAQESAAKSPLDEPFLPRDRASALIQAAMDQRVRHAEATAADALGGTEFLFSNADPLWATVLGSLIAKWLTRDAAPISDPVRTQPIAIEDEAHVALFSDWGTGRPPALAVAHEITKRDVGYLIHLGDIYYAGTEDEVAERFLSVLPTSTRLKRWFALNANHEMYSGGHAYFDRVLPAAGQPASYFCLENTHWRIIGLDTAHKDQELRKPQVEWLVALVSPSEGRMNILLSHHQLFSCFERTSAKLLNQVAPLLDAGLIHAWFWGHEHKHIVYKKHRGVLARCIGHGAIPANPPPARLSRPEFAVQFVNRRLRPDSLQGVNGFASLRFNGPSLDVEYVDEDGFVSFGENLDREIAQH